MKLSTHEDIKAPIEHVFAEVTNFEGFERQIMRRGADVVRTVDHDPPAPGMAWEAVGTFRGKRRTVNAELKELEPPNSLRFESQVGGLEGFVGVDLMALSSTRTRLTVELELVPTTLSAKLLVQSLKFAKGNLKKRFNARIADFAEAIGRRGGGGGKGKGKGKDRGGKAVTA